MIRAKFYTISNPCIFHNVLLIFLYWFDHFCIVNKVLGIWHETEEVMFSVYFGKSVTSTAQTIHAAHTRNFIAFFTCIHFYLRIWPLMTSNPCKNSYKLCTLCLGSRNNHNNGKYLYVFGACALNFPMGKMVYARVGGAYQTMNASARSGEASKHWPYKFF